MVNKLVLSWTRKLRAKFIGIGSPGFFESLGKIFTKTLSQSFVWHVTCFKPVITKINVL